LPELDSEFSEIFIPSFRKKFPGFLAALAIATVCIFIRSVYPVAELSEGWIAHLFREQCLFGGLKEIMVVIAMLALNIPNPVFCFEGNMSIESGFGVQRSKE
jgi:hypothetical protein